MKVNYSRLRCPNCGADDFSLSGADVFLCHYCNEKFSFNLDEIEFTQKNKVFVEDLTAQFSDKIKELYTQIYSYRKKINYYNKLSYPKKFKVISFVGMFFSIMFLFVFPLFSLFSGLLFFGALVLSYRHSNKQYEKYHPISSHYASKIVDCENEIHFYTRLLSKLKI